MKILLTGTRSPVTRDLALAFSACGHEVHGADSLILSHILPVFKTHRRYAPPALCLDMFASEAEVMLARLQPDLIIPLCEDIFYWRLAAGGREWPVFAPSLPLLMQLHSKFAFISLAQSLGLNAPVTRRLGQNEVPDAWESHVFKPEFSRFGVRILSRPRQRPHLVASPENPWLCQEWIEGEDLSFHAIAHDGRLRAFCAYRSTWRAHGGASYHFDPLEPSLAHEAELIAERLVAATNLTGQLACDLRHDRDGRLWLIECNPRATSGLHLLAHTPEALCSAFTGEAGQMCRMNNQPVCIGPAMWLYGLPLAIRTNRLGQWRRNLKRSRNALAGCGWSVVADSLPLAVRALLSGHSLQAFLTADIECNRDLSRP